MTPLGWSIIAISVFVGISIGYFIFQRFPNLFNEDRKMKKVMKNPHLLMEKLQVHGKLYDQGKYGEKVEMVLKVELDEESGKEILVIERKENPNLEQIKKRLSKVKEKEVKKKDNKITKSKKKKKKK